MMKLCGSGQWRLSKMFSLYIKKSDAPRFTISNLPANNKYKHTHVLWCSAVIVPWSWPVNNWAQPPVAGALLPLLLLLLGSLLMPILWSAPDGIKTSGKTNKTQLSQNKNSLLGRKWACLTVCPPPLCPSCFFFSGRMHPQSPNKWSLSFGAHPAVPDIFHPSLCRTCLGSLAKKQFFHFSDREQQHQGRRGAQMPSL